MELEHNPVWDTFDVQLDLGVGPNLEGSGLFSAYPSIDC